MKVLQSVLYRLKCGNSEDRPKKIQKVLLNSELCFNLKNGRFLYRSVNEQYNLLLST